MRTILVIIALSTVCRGASLSVGAAQQGQAGGFVGWGYILRESGGYSVPTFSEFSPQSDFGVYLDFVSLPANYVIVLPVAAGGQGFSQSEETGAGEFFIDPATPDGTIIDGTITLHYDLYSNNPDLNPDSFLSGDNSVSANVSIAVTGLETTPEPATVILITTALTCILIRRGRHR